MISFHAPTTLKWRSYSDYLYFMIKETEAQRSKITYSRSLNQLGFGQVVPGFNRVETIDIVSCCRLDLLTSYSIHPLPLLHSHPPPSTVLPEGNQAFQVLSQILLKHFPTTLLISKLYLCIVTNHCNPIPYPGIPKCHLILTMALRKRQICKQFEILTFPLFFSFTSFRFDLIASLTSKDVMNSP